MGIHSIAYLLNRKDTIIPSPRNLKDSIVHLTAFIQKLDPIHKNIQREHVFLHAYFIRLTASHIANIISVNLNENKSQ